MLGLFCLLRIIKLYEITTAVCHLLHAVCRFGTSKQHQTESLEEKEEGEWVESAGELKVQLNSLKFSAQNLTQFMPFDTNGRFYTKSCGNQPQWPQWKDEEATFARRPPKCSKQLSQVLIVTS